MIKIETGLFVIAIVFMVGWAYFKGYADGRNNRGM